ncbi:MAG: hypothetical protein HC803_07265 [Saprospiraceae bacterium]|nr:hypothetical protein [Saprospiraceae bacterium]
MEIGLEESDAFEASDSFTTKKKEKMWFKKLTDFVEQNPNQVRENLELDGAYLIPKSMEKV